MSTSPTYHNDMNSPMLKMTENTSTQSEKSTNQPTPLMPKSKLSQLKDEFRPGTVCGSIVTLFISVVGAGLVSVPLSFYYSGIFLSIFCYVMGAVMTYITCVWLVECSQITQKNTYMQIAEMVCSKWVMVLIKINFMINNWGYTMAFAVIINKLMARCVTQLAGSNAVNLPNQLTNPDGVFYSAVAIICICFPLSIRRQITGMSYLGILSFVITLYIFAVIIVNAFNPLYNQGDNIYMLEYFKMSGFWLCIPTAIFSFTCQQNILDIKQELLKPEGYTEKQELKDMKIVFGTTFGICLVLYSFVGFFGYLTFVQNPQKYLTDSSLGGIVLMGYTDFNLALVLGCLVLVVTLTFTMVFCYKPTKDCILEMVYPGCNYETVPMKQNVIVIGILCLMTILMTIVFKSLNILIIILGAVQGPIICFMLPAYFYYQLNKQNLTILTKILIFLVFGVLQVAIIALGLQQYIKNPN